MKRVGILTINDNTNYGNRLQNYAVQTVIEKYGFEVETITNKTHYGEGLREKLKKYNYNPKIVFDKVKKKIIYRKYRRVIDSKIKNCTEFNDRYMKLSKYEIKKENIPNNLANEYDYFVIGSDQVWNPNADRVSNIDFATFSPKEKNISFSASFGVNEIPEQYLKLYEEGLNNIDKLSVREFKGKEIIEEISGRKDAKVLVDPTLVLTAKEWENMIKKPSQEVPDKYVLTYFLGKTSKKREKFIKNVAKKYGLEIINLGSLKDEKYYDMDPSEFVYLFKNANLIFTDSFHGCVFSIIFEKAFYALNREDHQKSMNSRINTLFEKLELNNTLEELDINKVYLKADYTKQREIIKKEQEQVKEFLDNAFNIQ